MNWVATRPIRMITLGDHVTVHRGLVACLEQETDIEVSDMFASGREIVQTLKDKSLEVDVSLMDCLLGPTEINGLNLIRLIRVRYPGLEILVASAHHNMVTVGMVMHADTHGFVDKEEDLSESARAVRTMAAGGKRLNATLAIEMGRDALSTDAPMPVTNGVKLPVLIDRFEFSPRGYEVLCCCLDGMSVTGITGKLAHNIKTISLQEQSAYRKLGIRTGIELFRIRHELEEQ